MAQVVAATIEGLPEDRTTIESVWVRHPSYEFTYVRNRISNLKKLINTFSADLESQGKNPEALQRKVGEVLGSFEVEIGKHLAALRQDGQYQFRDVPKGHWAYDATYDLKILGILNGYDYDHYHG
jgi:hypothetical protein